MNTLFQNRCERIRRLIVSRPGITGRELCYATDTMKEFDRRDALAWLISEGKVREEITPTRGRPRRTYWPIKSAEPATDQPEAGALPLTASQAPRPATDPKPGSLKIEDVMYFNKRRWKHNLALMAEGKPPLPPLPLPEWEDDD